MIFRKLVIWTNDLHTGPNYYQCDFKLTLKMERNEITEDQRILRNQTLGIRIPYRKFDNSWVISWLYQ